MGKPNTNVAERVKAAVAESKGSEAAPPPPPPPPPSGETTQDGNGTAEGGKAPRKREITAESREKGKETKHANRVFNEYLEALTNGKVTGRNDKAEELEKELQTGTRVKQVPVWVDDGKGTGKKVRAYNEDGTAKMEEKSVPLKPAEKLRLQAEIERLRNTLPVNNRAIKLRPEFLRILPAYAAYHKCSRGTLLSVGVPAADLDEAGIK